MSTKASSYIPSGPGPRVVPDQKTVSHTPMKAYTSPSVPLVVFNDIPSSNIITKLLQSAKKRAQERFAYQRVMTTEEFLAGPGSRFPYPLQSVDMDSDKGKIVLVPDGAPPKDAQKARPRFGSAPSARNKGPPTVLLLTSPFLLRPCSKPNALGNDGEKVDGKPIAEGQQKRTVITSSYPPFSCLVSPKAPEKKPYNIEMDRLIALNLGFRRSVCDLLCKEEDVTLMGSELEGANIALLEMRVACAEIDEKHPEGGEAAYKLKFPLFDKFMSTCCRPVIKKPKTGADAQFQESKAPKTAAEKLKAAQEAKVSEITEFTGTEYLTFKSRVGFENPAKGGEFVHPNPLIRLRIDQINASCNGQFAYSSPVIYYLNPRNSSWDQMTPEQADSFRLFEQRKIIVSELFGNQFSPKGGPGVSQVRVNGSALFVWGIAGNHVPDNYAGGISMTGDPVDDSEVLGFLGAQKSTTDNPSEEITGFSHEPIAESAEGGTKRALGDSSSSSDPGPRKKVNTESSSAFYDEEGLTWDD